MDGAAPFTFGLLNPSFHSPSDPRWSASLPESISSPYYRFDLSGVSSVETFRGAESSTFEVEQFQRMDVSPKEGRRFMVRRQRSNEMQSMLKSPFYGSSSNTRHEHIDFDSIELGGRSQEAKRGRTSMIGKDVEVTANEQDEAMMEEGLKKIRLPTVEKIGIQVKTLNGHLVPIECELEWLCLKLKNEVESSTGVPVSEQRLIFGGIALNDYKSLADYNVTDGSLVYMVVSLRGG